MPPFLRLEPEKEVALVVIGKRHEGLSVDDNRNLVHSLVAVGHDCRWVAWFAGGAEVVWARSLILPGCVWYQHAGQHWKLAVVVDYNLNYNPRDNLRRLAEHG